MIGRRIVKQIKSFSIFNIFHKLKKKKHIPMENYEYPLDIVKKEYKKKYGVEFSGFVDIEFWNFPNIIVPEDEEERKKWIERNVEWLYTIAIKE